MKNILQALDSRMMQIVNNFAAIIAMMIAALIFSWEIGLLGTACLILLVIGQYFTANRMQHCNDEAINNDLTGQVNSLAFSVFFSFTVEKRTHFEWSRFC